MKVDFEGRQYEWDFDSIGVDEWRVVKRVYKMTPKAVQLGIDEADPDAMTVAYWTMLQQSGLPAGTLGDNLKPDILALNQAIGTAAEQELAERQEREKAELEAAAEQAAKVPPTLPAGPPSAAPPSQATTTQTLPGPAETTTPSTGSSTGTSSSSEPSTSSPSPASATSPTPPSGG